MALDIKYFGIRHHGPGSAKRLVDALEQQQPKKVLIEGPADCSDLLPYLDDPQIKLPIAMLGYKELDKNDVLNQDNITLGQPIKTTSEQAVYFPFAEYSPEYQACIWALKNNVPVQFIDLPLSITLIEQQAPEKEKCNCRCELNEDDEYDEYDEYDEDECECECECEECVPDLEEATPKHPFDELAKISGYQDSESWWNDMFEQGNNSSATFTLIEEMMAKLRDEYTTHHPASLREQQREAHMRVEIAKAAKSFDDSIAVVVGAWHLPALTAKAPLKHSKDLLKTLPTKIPKSKIKKTWIPWTTPRLSLQSGYGAGIKAPMWYQHLWQESPSALLEVWVVKIATALRQKGHLVSTALLIDTVKLAQSLTITRQNFHTGFEDITDAIISCLCFGDKLLWTTIEQQVLLGDQIGTVPDTIPLVPLFEDFKKRQKECNLKTQALPHSVRLDLRTNSGLKKSAFLHQMNLLGIHWGRISHNKNAKGTFREDWALDWQPEFNIELIENLVYGATIIGAAKAKTLEKITNETQVNTLAELVFTCLFADFRDIAEFAIRKIDELVTYEDNNLSLLKTLPPLISVCRYGSARELPNEYITLLIHKIITQVTVSLSYTCRDISISQAEKYLDEITIAHNNIVSYEFDRDINELWWQGIMKIQQDFHVNLLISGAVTAICYNDKKISSDDLTFQLDHILSPTFSPQDSALFFDGFFRSSIQIILYDDVLVEIIKSWVNSMDEELFIHNLPLLRRIFSRLDPMESRQLLSRLFPAPKQEIKQEPTTTLDAESDDLWQSQLDALLNPFSNKKE